MEEKIEGARGGWSDKDRRSRGEPRHHTNQKLEKTSTDGGEEGSKRTRVARKTRPDSPSADPNCSRAGPTSISHETDSPPPVKWQLHPGLLLLLPVIEITCHMTHMQFQSYSFSIRATRPFVLSHGKGELG